MHEELSPHGFTVFAVAVDESAADARPWVAAGNCTFPVVYDRDRVAIEALGIINVPTVMWLDEGNRIVRPQDSQFSNDNLIAFHGKASAPHLDALRRWVIDGEAPMDPSAARDAARLPTDDEQLARAHFRVGVHLLRAGKRDAALRHFEEGGELSPLDWTIRRAAIALRGDDPFLSDEFIAMYTAWQDEGRPGYRVPT